MHDFGCNDTGFMFFAFLSVGILYNGAAIFEKKLSTTTPTTQKFSLARQTEIFRFVSAAETTQEKPSMIVAVSIIGLFQAFS